MGGVAAIKKVSQIIKPPKPPAPAPIAPTTAEISQSTATDAAAYDNRKTKAKGRSMTILTSSRGVKDNNTTLGKKSLLGL
jgi:hypothetical protein